MPEWQHQGSDANYPEWRYLLSPEGEFLVMASASQVAVFAVDQPDKPLSVMNLPENYAGYSLGSLSVGPHGETMVLGIYKSERFGANFTSEILELTRNGRMMSLDSSFKPRAWAAGSELVGAFQTMSHDGQTLAVSEYQRVETNKTDFTILGSQITVTLGYPAISIWERDEHMQWRLRQRIEWKGRQGSGKLEIRPPLRTDLLTSWQIDGNKTFTAFQIHQNLQLSPDGRFLLSGVQTDRKFITLTVTSHLFDIQGNQPDLLGHMTMSVENASNSLIAYPH